MGEYKVGSRVSWFRKIKGGVIHRRTGIIVAIGPLNKASNGLTRHSIFNQLSKSGFDVVISRVSIYRCRPENPYVVMVVPAGEKPKFFCPMIADLHTAHPDDLDGLVVEKAAVLAPVKQGGKKIAVDYRGLCRRALAKEIENRPEDDHRIVTMELFGVNRGVAQYLVGHLLNRR